MNVRALLFLASACLSSASCKDDVRAGSAPSSPADQHLLGVMLDASMGVMPRTDVTQWVEAGLGEGGAGVSTRIEVTAAFESPALYDMAAPERKARVERIAQVLFTIQDAPDAPVQTVVVDFEKPGLLTRFVSVTLEREAILESLRRRPLLVAPLDGGASAPLRTAP